MGCKHFYVQALLREGACTYKHSSALEGPATIFTFTRRFICSDNFYDMAKKESSTRILVFEVDARRYGLFEDDVAKVKRYSDKMVSGRVSGDAGDVGIRSFREYLSIPEELYGNKPFLIRSRSGGVLLSVDAVCKIRRVKIYDIFPTAFDYIKEAHIDGQRTPLFNLQDLLALDPPFGDDVMDLIRNGEYASTSTEQNEAGELEEGVRTEEEDQEEFSSGGEEARKDQNKGGFVPYTLFIFSLAVLFLSLFAIVRSEYLGGFPFRMLSAGAQAEEGTDRILSFLTYQTRTTVQGAVLEVLRQKKEDLRRVESGLKELEKQKRTYLESVDRSETLYEENLSVFDLDESQRWLRSIVDLVRNSVEFKDEAQRRREHFLKIYEDRRSGLLAEKSEYEQQIAELTSYIETVSGQDSADRLQDIPLYHGELYLDEMKSNRLNRFFIALENDDYENALRALDSVSALPLTERERAAATVIDRTLNVLQDYSARMSLLRNNAPFDDIKLSFLNENYTETRSMIHRFEEKGYLKPLLSGLDGAVAENMEINQRIDDGLALRQEVRELIRKAALFEQKGEHEKAVNAYEDLLLFPLPVYDREYILRKVHALWLDVELKRIKREENTKAIKYLESARILRKEGNGEKALEYYQLLLSECPHSDFVEDAVREIMLLSPAGKSSL